MKKLITSLLLLVSVSSFAKTISDEQTWVNLNAFIKINENWQGYLEYQPRFFDYNKYKGATLHRAAIGRNISNGFTGWLGYGMITWDYRSQSKFPSKNQHEDRPFLMLTHNHDFNNNWKLSNRTRYEFRMFRHDQEASERIRHLIRTQYKFGNSPWALAVWDEYFWNTNSIHPSRESHGPVTLAGFDQNRAFAGVAYFFGENQQHMFETGYMNNYVNGARNDRNAHVWMTTISGKF